MICIYVFYVSFFYRFFKGRIYFEEICLISFFGLDYIEYQKNVPRTGVPFVQGYIPTPSASGSYNTTNIVDQALQDYEEDSSSDSYSSSSLSSDDNFQRVEDELLVEA